MFSWINILELYFSVYKNYRHFIVGTLEINIVIYFTLLLICFWYYRISLISSTNISVVLPEPSVLKTEDIDPTVNSESLTNGSQIVPPVVVRSVPVTAIVDDVSNMSLSSVNSQPKVLIKNNLLIVVCTNDKFYDCFIIFRFKTLLQLQIL